MTSQKSGRCGKKGLSEDLGLKRHCRRQGQQRPHPGCRCPGAVGRWHPTGNYRLPGESSPWPCRRQCKAGSLAPLCAATGPVRHDRCDGPPRSRGLFQGESRGLLFRGHRHKPERIDRMGKRIRFFSISAGHIIEPAERRPCIVTCGALTLGFVMIWYPDPPGAIISHGMLNRMRNAASRSM